MSILKPQRRVVIVDDSRTIQAILDNAFSNRGDFRVVGFASDATAAVEMIRRLAPDIVTIDLCMPYIDGEALLEMLDDLDHVCKVVVSDKSVTSRLLAGRLIHAGASLCLGKGELVDNPLGFFRKINDAADIVASRKRIAQGRVGVAPLPSAVLSMAQTAKPRYQFPVPADEKQRIVAGGRRNLFNAIRERQFDAVTKHIARLTAFPVSLLTFIDHDTQWVKSTYGLDVESTPRDQAFCNYTISQGGAFVVANAATDDRFSANPLVAEAPGIRSYTGHPVTTVDGVAIGSLCLIDTRVRTVSKHVLDQLAGMAEIVAEMINLRPARAA